MSCALLERRRWLPIDAAQIRICQRIKRHQQFMLHGRQPQRFQKEMIETKSQIEGRIAEPRALCVKENWAARAEQDVLWTDVAMHNGEPGSCGSFGKRFEYRSEVCMHARCREQIRLEPKRVERRARIELCSGCWRFCEGCVDRGQITT